MLRIRVDGLAHEAKADERLIDVINRSGSNRIPRASLCQTRHCTVYFGVENQNAEGRQESFKGFQSIVSRTGWLTAISISLSD